MISRTLIRRGEHLDRPFFPLLEVEIEAERRLDDSIHDCSI